ncbi:hypothetical protein AGLY_015909 [Aphis glycines]|uniref:Uncharacterized protein n=1 Tax=Aphis glycines TaxID=307491 RepID=A0A6G0T191_APHGL|nr:hypothetical protein AGLY_015909 [Aphis glycines]
MKRARNKMDANISSGTKYLNKRLVSHGRLLYVRNHLILQDLKNPCPPFGFAHKSFFSGTGCIQVLTHQNNKSKQTIGINVKRRVLYDRPKSKKNCPRLFSVLRPALVSPLAGSHIELGFERLYRRLFSFGAAYLLYVDCGFRCSGKKVTAAISGELQIRAWVGRHSGNTNRTWLLTVLGNWLIWWIEPLWSRER